MDPRREFMAWLDRLAPTYGRASLRSVSVPRDGKEHLVDGVMVFLEGHGSGDEELLEYGRLTMWRTTATVDEARDILQEVIADEQSKSLRPGAPFKINRHPSQMGASPLEWPLPFHEATRFSGFPERHFAFRVEEAAQFPQPPIAKLGLQTILDVDATLTEWLGHVRPSLSDPYFLVALPDFRAAILEITIKARKAIVRFTAKEPSEVSCEFAYNDGTKVRQQTKAGAAGEVSWKYGATPPSMYFILHHISSGEVLDWARVDPFLFEEHPDIHVLAPPEIVDEALTNGEGLRIEFKAIETKTRPDETVESLVAFANSEGGHLFVGIHDDLRILGVKDPNRTAQRLQSWAHSRIDPPLDIATRTAEIDGKLVVIAEVPQGRNKPYMLRESGRIYVRRNDSDQAVTRSELDALYRQRPPEMVSGGKVLL